DVEGVRADRLELHRRQRAADRGVGRADPPRQQLRPDGVDAAGLGRRLVLAHVLERAAQLRALEPQCDEPQDEREAEYEAVEARRVDEVEPEQGRPRDSAY